METVYIVQGFIAGKRGRVMPDKPVVCKDAAEAIRKAGKLADNEKMLGVMAYSQTADAEAGEYSEPVMLASHGEVPEM
jgi:hypothetical protein